MNRLEICPAKRTASINFTSAPTTGGTLTTEWITGYGGTTGLPLTEGAISVTSICNDGYWRIVAGDGLNGGVYTGTFTATGVSQQRIKDDVAKLHFNSCIFFKFCINRFDIPYVKVLAAPN
jgi:hypothetical protein